MSQRSPRTQTGEAPRRAGPRAVALVLALTMAAMPGCSIGRRPPEPQAATATPVPRTVPSSPPASTAPPAAPKVPAQTAGTAPGLDEGELPEGVFHVVQSGQTLWRIARGYGVTIESIVAANRIPDPASIEIGAALFVPGASATVDIAPYPAPVPIPPARRIERRSGDREWLWPLSGDILSRFGARRRTHLHRGVDIRGHRGEEIVATRAGRVVFAGRGGGGYGLTVVIDHGDAEQSLYAHNEALLVKVGDEVHQGAPIARCGRSGNATTEHVHFEIRKDNKPQDPMPLLGEILEARR